MAPSKQPEVIDLLSSPEPESVPKPTRTASARTKIANKENIPRNNSPPPRGEDGKSRSGVPGVLEPSWSFPNETFSSPVNERGNGGPFKEIKKTTKKEKEMTETEKIQELRLKRFSGMSRSTSAVGSDLRSSQIQKEVDGIPALAIEAGKTIHNGGDIVENEKEPNNSTSTSHAREDTVMLDLVSDQDHWGGIDLTQDDDDDFGDFGISTKSQREIGRMTVAEPERRHETKNKQSEAADFSDPFRSLTPDEVPKNQSRASTSSSKARNEVDSGMKHGTKEIHTKRTNFSDSFRSSSSVNVSKDPKMSSSTPDSKSRSRFEEDLSLLDDDKYGTPVDFDQSYDIELPVAKRQRVSPIRKDMSNNASQPKTKETGGYRRTVSAVAQSSHSFQPKASGLKRSKTMDSDPITFTSSPDPFDYKNKRAEKRKIQPDDDGFIDIDDIPKRTAQSVSARPDLAERHKSKIKNLDSIFSDDDASEDSSASLPDISNIATSKTGAKKSLTGKSTTTKATTSTSRDTSISAAPSPSRTKPASSKSALAAYEKKKAADKKAQDKVVKASEKEAAKVAEKEKKKLEKEQKAIEKEREAAIAKVNMARTDKKASRREMIVDFPRGFDAKLAEHTKVLLGSVEVECGEWISSIPNVIRWKRKVDGEWDEEEACWMPRPLSIQEEKHALVVIKGEEFVQLVNGDEQRNLDSHVLKMKGKFEDHSKTAGGIGGGGKNILYVIEGLTSFIKKNQNAKNRKFADAVRDQMEQEGEGAAAGGNGSGGSRRKGKGKASDVQEIDEEEIEDALLSLQVVHGVLVHNTGSLAETAQSITAFTQHLATARYRKAQDSLSENFCMKPGQVKSGADSADTFIKMLQETNRLTAPIAHSIAAEYPTATKLTEAFEEAQKKENALKRKALGDGRANYVVPEAKRANTMLKDLRKDARSDGAVSDRAVGPKMSVRLFKVFLGRDERSSDI